MFDIPILYINLDHRTDRRKHMEEILNGYNYTRISAVKDDINGYIGCAKSHIKCLQYAKSMDYDKVVILEDDFMFVGDNNFNDIILPEVYDILLLCNLIKGAIEHDNVFNKVSYAEWTSGHIVKKHMYDILIDNLQDGINHLSQDNNRNYYLDVYWNDILVQFETLAHKKRFARQKESYSDIKRCFIKR
jgi:hypothetical protein